MLFEIPVTLGRDAPFESVLGVVIPAGTSEGNYFLGAYIDHDNLIMETTVANNAAYYPISVLGSAPALVTDSAMDITAGSARLNATINPNGASTTLEFDYGTSTTYGSTLSLGDVGAGTTEVSTGAVVTGLNCGTSYHYRARGLSSAGTGLGGDGTFTTAACSPGC